MAKKLDKLKKLSPEERIEKLKELQEESKKEIEEAQKLIKESEEQATQEEKLKQQIPVPQLKSVDIESLFSPEEKELFKAKRYTEEKKQIKKEKPEKPLEQTVFEEAPIRIPEEVAEIIEHARELSYEPASKLRERAENIYEEVKRTGEITYEQKKEMDGIGYGNIFKVQDIGTGDYPTADRRAAEDMVITQKIKNWLQDKYKGQSQYQR